MPAITAETNLISSISNVENLACSTSREARCVAASETPPYQQKAPVLQKASVEQIWSSWRYEKPAPASANAAEHLNQLKRIGEYERALQVALAEVKLEEQGGRITGEHATVPWYYREAATIHRKLERYDEEAALIRRFARNYDVHFRAFSKRYRSRSGAHEAWAAKFLERLDKAKAAAAARREDDAN